jgi:tetratricopeptide (TPR) repeat protein
MSDWDENEMGNRVKGIVATTAWVAVMLIIARVALPYTGLSGADDQVLPQLVRMTPVLVGVLALAVIALAIDFIVLRTRSGRYAPDVRRILAEAEQGSDVYGYDKELGETIKVERAGQYRVPQQPEIELSYNGLTSQPAGTRNPTGGSNPQPQPENVNQIANQIIEPQTVEPKIVHDLNVETVTIVEAKRTDESDVMHPRMARGVQSDIRRNSALIPETDDNQVVEVGKPEDRPFRNQAPAVTDEVRRLPVEPQDIPALHQLPPPLPEFAGRSSEISELLAACKSSTSGIVCLQGTGGVGKTTLAIMLGHELAPQYPDAQIYIDLKGANAEPLSVAEAQAQIVRANLPTARLPENEVELNQLYHSVLRGRRALLLLDNAANAQQITPLLPAAGAPGPNGCLSIITSRQNISIPQMYSFRLGTLSLSEAKEMLNRLVNYQGNRVEKIADLCGRLPLALRLAAGAMAQMPDQAGLRDARIEAYAQRLEDLQNTEKSTGPVDAVLRASSELLLPGLQRFWRMLTVFSDTFDVNAAAAIWKVNPALARDALKRLISYSLIERNSATGRFRLHDLMRSFASLGLTREERATAHQRLSAHYHSVLHEADALYEQGQHYLKQGLNLLDLEWHNIQAGQIWAATNAEQDRAACELCATYPDAGKYVRGLRQHPRERIRWSEAALASSRQLNRRKAAGRHLIALGDCYSDLSEIPQAIECYEQALEHAKGIKDSRGEADALSGLGTAYYLGGNLNRARDYHEAALEIARAIHDQRVEAISLGNLGITHFALGEVIAATVLFDQQLRVARGLGDRRNESAAWGELGTAHIAIGKPQEAISLLEQQLEITREIGDRRGEANGLCHLGIAYAKLKKHQWSVPFLEESLAVAREIGDRRNEANALGGLGIAYNLHEEYAVAMQFFDEQLKLATEIGDRRTESLALTNLGEACIADGNARRAIDLLQKSFSITSQTGDLLGQANSLFYLSIALNKFGDRRQAVAQAKTALEYFETAQHPDAEKVREKLSEWGQK